MIGQCPECGQGQVRLSGPDRTGRNVCDQCYVPTREALASDAATSDVTVPAPRLGHCTPVWGGHSPACDRDGTYCSMTSTHSGPCKPHQWPENFPRPRY